MGIELRLTRFHVAVCISFLFNLPASVRASEPSGPPIPITDAAAKTGSFQAKLTERSPLSKPADVSKRMGIPVGKDYELAKETFTLFVPKEAGEAGKFGLMVGMNFREYGDAPKAWKPVLDKYHMIWIGPQNIGIGRDDCQRIGLVLDAVYGARKTWPIDDRRVYACICFPEEPASGVDLEYPDIFQGGLHSLGWSWIEKVYVGNDRRRSWQPHSRRQWLNRPDTAMWNLARTRSRFFCADRSEQSQATGTNMSEDVANAYLKAGFKHVRVISAPFAKMGHYGDYAADWFDEGISFLDAPLSEKEVTATAAPAQAPAPATSQPAPGKPATQPPGPDDKEVAAQRALSLAKSYIAAQSYAAARTRLQKVVSDYPQTEAAKEAKPLLQQIQDK